MNMANKKILNKQQQQQQMRDENDDKYEAYSSFKTVLFYCSLVLFFPVSTFFATKVFIFDELLDLDPIKSNIYAAASAVIALHLALGLYIYRAYFEIQEPMITKKQE